MVNNFLSDYVLLRISDILDDARFEVDNKVYINIPAIKMLSAPTV